MFRMDGAWHFKHGAVHRVYLASLLATTDESKTSVSAVMACDTAGDNLFPFFCFQMFTGCQLYSWIHVPMHICVSVQIVSIVQRSIQFLQALFFTPSTDSRRREGQSWIFLQCHFSQACLRWVVVELCDHKLAPDLSWFKNRSSVLVESLNDSGTNAWMQTSNP